jgi:hypothetical protein
MKQAAIVLLLALAAASPEMRYFHYERSLQNLLQQPGQACLALDPEIFAHAAPQLADLRLYRGATETPYVVRYAAPVQLAPSNIAPLNLGQYKGQTVFDADLPGTKYNDIELSITAQNFIATVTVSGSHKQTEGNTTKLGSYTIFDLTRERLGRSTVLHLPESDFPYLHFQITGPISPENITGLSVVRQPIILPRYQTVATSSQITQKGHSSVIEFTVPANVPVDRIVFTPGPEPANFSRSVRVSIAQLSQPPTKNTTESLISSGNLLRVHRAVEGHKIDEENLAIAAPFVVAVLPSKWTITIDNGDDTPLDLKSIQLQMLERTFCFEAAAKTSYTLYYGDPALSPPRYDYAALFSPQPDAARITTAPEQPNPAFQHRPDNRPVTERHPALLWIALVVVIALLGAIALRSAKPTTQAPQ